MTLVQSGASGAQPGYKEESKRRGNHLYFFLTMTISAPKSTDASMESLNIYIFLIYYINV